MKTISSLFAILALAAPAAFAQEKAPAKPQPQAQTQIVVPNYNAIHIPYLIPDQNIVTVPAPYPLVQDGTLGLTWQDANFVHPNVRVELNLNRAPIQEALKRLFSQVKMDYTVEQDVPAEARITLRVKNVTFLTALNAITEEANVGWNVDTSGTLIAHATRYHIGKNLQQVNILSMPLLQALPQNYLNNRLNYWHLQPQSGIYNQLNLNSDLIRNANTGGNLLLDATPIQLNYSASPSIKLETSLVMPLNYHFVPNVISTTQEPIKSEVIHDNHTSSTDKGGEAQRSIPVLKDIPLIGNLFTYRVKEERTIFTCPHCHKEITVIKKSQVGTANDWKFCPYCGKEIAGTAKKSRQ